MRNGPGRRSDAPEIVTVVTECRLIDSGGTEWRYWRPDGRGLAPGLYVAVPPPIGARARFGEQTGFSGPFETEADAMAALYGLAPAPLQRPALDRAL